MLYLLPNLLADLESHQGQLPSSVDVTVASLTHLIAENEKEGRHFLRRFSFPSPKTFRDIPIHLLNEHTTAQQKKELIAEVHKGGVWGLVSDCGMPCLADPGADLVLMARDRGIPVEAFSGPSSPLLALVLSGLGGQHFTFHGYLPKEMPALVAALQRIEALSKKEGSTHLCIETPYKNQRLFDTLLECLDEETFLCVACDLTAPGQWVVTRRIRMWKLQPAREINKRPCLFVLKAKF